MTRPTWDTRWRVGLPAVLVFIWGAMAGVAIDRFWLTDGARATELLAAAPLTAQSLAEDLELDASQKARIDALLDSLRPVLERAAVQGPDSLQAAARMARQRLEEALPDDRRPPFERWMSDRQAQMMDDMRSGNMMRWTPMVNREMMQRWMPREGSDSGGVGMEDGCDDGCRRERWERESGRRWRQ